eukprot:TRINITY_DN19718_c0_g1_i1.p1 TRINITY_DN19718_c0_g1~~TRINITY_DN19718_c0_g1_i1.p1  ORF type:complete len:187 (+),score=42.75 TRINITY_DN19718_c0_g1_i1:105-665(+)
MFQCRMCTENPFVSLFGGATGPRERRERKQTQSRQRDARNSTTSRSSRDESKFEPRNDGETEALVREWLQYAHPRAREFFVTEEALKMVLEKIIKGVEREDDPVLSSDAKCVFWFGDVTKEDMQAAIRMIKPGEAVESITYVNRILAFIFATDESFEELMQLPKAPFKMSCGDQLCVHLAHISVST